MNRADLGPWGESRMRRDDQRVANKAILIVLSALCLVMIIFLGAWTLVAHLQ
jgi:hypothetical protein